MKPHILPAWQQRDTVGSVWSHFETRSSKSITDGFLSGFDLDYRPRAAGIQATLSWSGSCDGSCPYFCVSWPRRGRFIPGLLGSQPLSLRRFACPLVDGIVLRVRVVFRGTSRLRPSLRSSTLRLARLFLPGSTLFVPRSLRLWFRLPDFVNARAWSPTHGKQRWSATSLSPSLRGIRQQTCSRSSRASLPRSGPRGSSSSGGGKHSSTAGACRSTSPTPCGGSIAGPLRASHFKRPSRSSPIQWPACPYFE
jgi:hypothetical protein